MRICYLAPAESSHIQKWTECMAGYGHDVHVISLRGGDLPNATLHVLGSTVGRNDSDLRKLSYLKFAQQAKEIVTELRPDILHAHYASSYGLLAALSCPKPYYLSVWGSDIYDFPNKSILHKLAIRYALNRADWLMSTSEAMAEESSKYTDKHFDITPFGVDMNLFNPMNRKRHKGDGRFVVGTIKALEPVYGIDTLLKGVASAIDIRPNLPIEVRIGGKGSQLKSLQELSNKLGISDRITWLGYIPKEQVAVEWANLDVAIIMSERESFGVSSVEAQASGLPVIYSDIPGLLEAAEDGKQGLALQPRDYQGLAASLVKLFDNEAMRKQMGESAREYVLNTFNIEECFRRIESIYVERK